MLEACIPEYVEHGHVRPPSGSTISGAHTAQAATARQQAAQPHCACCSSCHCTSAGCTSALPMQLVLPVHQCSACAGQQRGCLPQVQHATPHVVHVHTAPVHSRARHVLKLMRVQVVVPSATFMTSEGRSVILGWERGTVCTLA